jgi:hypothetical protein
VEGAKRQALQKSLLVSISVWFLLRVNAITRRGLANTMEASARGRLGRLGKNHIIYSLYIKYTLAASRASATKTSV